ncbi:Titin [Mizuhopecten yessoensis]|uniref:Titin n=1 Tax=Mizuhopecten yessoensis TaxID=6573 RepID=A0A210QQE7_MIZYE|nr:Titin [Mizuhopecten yessoensis]
MMECQSRVNPGFCGRRYILAWSALFLSLAATVQPQQSWRKDSACADSSFGYIFGHDDMATCRGQWQGHIRNSSQLCAPGWGVCSWQDAGRLRAIRWEEAVSVHGCFAYNAANDGGRCRECGKDMERDDLAGIGIGCPHQNFGQTSCISGGRIDASCCVDAHFKTACHYRPTMSGVLCCRKPSEFKAVEKPRILVRPRPMMQVSTGQIFLLTCQAHGTPPPRTQWYKDGTQITKASKRIQILSSGDLLVTMARRSDSGLYSCEVINSEGVDMASSIVVIREHLSGCRDGSTEGLGTHEYVHACAGKWAGHVRKGRSLCRKGWKVCSPSDTETLRDLSWMDVFDVDGCYAYNAASRQGTCRRCKKGNMAGFGRKCGKLRYTKQSCLSQGRIDVFKVKDKTKGCSYREGVTSGVLCCKKSAIKTPAGKFSNNLYQSSTVEIEING